MQGRLTPSTAPEDGSHFQGRGRGSAPTNNHFQGRLTPPPVPKNLTHFQGRLGVSHPYKQFSKLFQKIIYFKWGCKILRTTCNFYHKHALSCRIIKKNEKYNSTRLVSKSVKNTKLALSCMIQQCDIGILCCLKTFIHYML